MKARVWKRLGLGYGPILTFVGSVIALGGPDGAARALRATINYMAVGTGYEAAPWVTGESLMFLRAPLIFAVLAVPIWAFWPARRTASAMTRDSVVRASASKTNAMQLASPEAARLRLKLGPGTLLSPENLLEETYSEFHRLADRADAGSQQAADLAVLVAPWLDDAGKRYWASSEPYHRLHTQMLERLEQLGQSTGGVMRPKNDPTHIERGDWLLDFNPQSPRGKKGVTFLPSGRVGEGRNANESQWRLHGNVLTVTREDGTLQNEFRWDAAAQRFICSNTSGARGIRNQTIQRVYPLSGR